MNDWIETEYGRVPSHWKCEPLGSLSNKLTDGSHFSPKPQNSGKFMCSVKDMTYNRFVFDNCKLISQKDYNFLVSQGCNPEKNDIIISKDGANCLDLIFVFNQDEDIVLLSSIAIVKLKKEYDPKFVRYFLLSPSCQYIMKSNFVSGTAIPRVVLKDFKKVPILIPPLPEQKSIAAILSSLDDKIENLRRQNQTLENIAQTLFKHWFVDFEFPNEHGKPYKSSGGKMVDSELGEIPEGWRVGKSGNLILLQGGYAFKSKDFRKTGRNGIVKIKNIQNNLVDINNTDFVADSVIGALDSKFRIESGNVLIAMTGAEVAKLGIVPKNNKSLWLNQRVGLFKEKVDFGIMFIYLLFSKPEYQKLLKDKGTGSSAQPNISSTDIESIDIVMPTYNILNRFGSIIQPCFVKIIENLNQIQTLIKTRDTLLPKLMSGEIRVEMV